MSRLDTVLRRIPSIDVEARLAVNGTTPTDVGVAVWNKLGHVFYDTPKQFAADFAAYVGAKRDWTDEQIAEFRWTLAQAITPDLDDSSEPSPLPEPEASTE